MEKADIEATLRKIDPKFADQLTEQEKERAVQEFKALYAGTPPPIQRKCRRQRPNCRGADESWTSASS